MSSRRIFPVAALAAAVTGGAVALRRSGRIARTWGATQEEVALGLAGDTFVMNPTQRATMAISIDAGVDQVWPWLVQMGKRRGGLYSYDWLDRIFGILDAQSAKRLLPEFQALSVGDVIPIGKSGGFPVLAVDPSKHLVLGGGDDEWTVAWSFVTTACADGMTRLITRYQANYPATLKNRLIGKILTPAAFLMTRRMLLNLKQRAEDLAMAPTPASVVPH